MVNLSISERANQPALKMRCDHCGKIEYVTFINQNTPDEEVVCKSCNGEYMERKEEFNYYEDDF